MTYMYVCVRARRVEEEMNDIEISSTAKKVGTDMRATVG
jgi:hypothetical protein